MLDHPGGSGYRNFFGFYDHAGYGGPLPPKNELSSSHRVWYADECPSGSASRLIFGAEWYWGHVQNASGDWVPLAQVIEILPAHCKWPDEYKSGNWHTYLHYYSPGHDCKGCGHLKQYLVLTGSQFGLTVPKGAVVDRSIDWESLRKWAVQRGFFWEQSHVTATQSVYVGVETIDEGHADLYAADFRVSGAGH